MLSRSQQKLLRKLTAKKQRWQHRLFIAEGRKVVNELLVEGLKPELLLTEEGYNPVPEGAIQLSPKDFDEWSALEKSDGILGIFAFPEFDVQDSKLVLVLDEIRDPGNLGTIMRTADWFGVNKIYCTPGTVDAYNSKCVQSSMGSIARVAVEYDSNQEILNQLKGREILCANMDGKSADELKMTGQAALVFGSESHGLSDFWLNNAIPVTIPRSGNSKTESLNVAIAGAILMEKLKG